MAVVGASFDPPDAQKHFADKNGFPFRLLADVDKTAGIAYDVIRYPGEPYEHLPRRVTYLIDLAGIIRRVYVVTDTDAHGAEVLADLERLGEHGNPQGRAR